MSAAEEQSGAESDSAADEILGITAADLADDRIVAFIRGNLSRNYYASREWTDDFYTRQAYIGCIAVSYQNRLLMPEMQKRYCIMEFTKLHIPKKVRRAIRRLSPGELTIRATRDPTGSGIERVIKGIARANGKNNWLGTRYITILKRMNEEGPIAVGDSLFQVECVEVMDANGKLLAGEVGYTMGGVYTSLSGFVNKKDPQCSHRAVGLLQMIALGKLLEKGGYDYWNLGHPPSGGQMQYKIDIGGEILPRFDFLQRWDTSRAKRPEKGLSTQEPVCLRDLLQVS
ncbi:hypothetical protein FOL47_008818 [Perkinsus chesapeaki]|uniref:Leucyl/phenylalanyl-tRNA--protein transferase n=1 Tax=Perkinsus chesapeaki TaxID=330153 RepID=A0A7J6LBP2_PERCH|nr:hypothetical protein FOL47_008818 [Perkinsus chesapeaki]